MTKPLNELSPEEREARLLSTAGFAARAGRIVYGTDMICDNLRRGEILLVLEASDTSDNTHKKLSDKTAFYAVRHVRLAAMGDRLATAFGKRGGKIAAVGITDSGILRAIEKYLPQSAE